MYPPFDQNHSLFDVGKRYHDIFDPSNQLSILKARQNFDERFDEVALLSSLFDVDDSSIRRRYSKTFASSKGIGHYNGMADYHAGVLWASNTELLRAIGHLASTNSDMFSRIALNDNRCFIISLMKVNAEPI